MNYPKTGQVFLATTALEEFWDTTMPIVFLGEWCLLYRRRSFWEPLNGQLLQSSLNSVEAAEAFYRYVDIIYERTLPILGETLNAIHGTRHGQRYWRIVLGPWLQIYLPVIYDRYRHVERALAQYPDCTSMTLSENLFVTPANTLEYGCLVKEDSYNLQIFTKIFAVLGKTFPCKGTQTVEATSLDTFISNSWRHKVAGYLGKIYAGLSARLFQTVFYKGPLFSKASEFYLFMRTTGRAIPIYGQLTKQKNEILDSNIRQNLKNILLGDSGFERCLSLMLYYDMPKCFLEGYGNLSNEVRNTYPKSPKVILSANAWYCDEGFKHWAAASAEKGALLVGTPHGGAYGGIAYMPAENHETAIVDRYYSWGWDRTDCAAKVIPFPATKLLGRKKIRATNLDTGILWATTSLPRYLLVNEVASFPAFASEYILWQERFAKTLHQKLVPALRLRPHREDGEWGVAQRLKECLSSLSIETWDLPFQESLSNCRLYVCDHCSTTFAEALSVNKPTILFWNPEINKLRQDAQPYYDLLRKSGILFDTPESAGEAVNRVYDDVETWWNYPERQNAVEIFCERYARNAPNAIELWAAELKKVAAMSRHNANRVG